MCDTKGCVHINADIHRSKMRTLDLLELELQTVLSCPECILERISCPVQQQCMLLTTDTACSPTPIPKVCLLLLCHTCIFFFHMWYLKNQCAWMTKKAERNVNSEGIVHDISEVNKDYVRNRDGAICVIDIVVKTACILFVSCDGLSLKVID